MSDHHWNLQKAIFSAISGIAGGRIYDNAPQNVEFPWVEIGESLALPDDLSAADEGVVEITTLNIWSRYRGQKEIKQIASAIHDALHGVNLAVTGRTSAHCWVRRFRPRRDPDGVTRQGIVTIETIHRT